MALLSIRNLHASIGDKEILKGVNLEINRGEVHSIMGPNGNGKSTLAGVVAGNPKYTVTAGEVIFKGKNILDLEDFIVSNNLLPLGAFYLTVFCMHRCGWGAENALAEINAGEGWKFPRWPLFYLKWVLPLIILLVWVLELLP